MKAFICQTCAHRSLEDQAPEKCPVCGSQSFQQDENAIMGIQDPNNITDAEKKHTPVVKVHKECNMIDGCVGVHAMVGEILHPMEEAHLIKFIDFYQDKKFITRVQLTPSVNPGTGVNIKNPQGKLQVVEFCNLHGAWMTEIDL